MNSVKDKAADMMATHGSQGYKMIEESAVKVDGKEAVLIRTSAGASRIGGEHESYVYYKEGGLMGFMRMTKEVSEMKPAQKDRAYETAIAFLKVYAPDLLNNFDNLWIREHSESFTDENGVKHTVTGMKVKCYNRNDGTYFWVVSMEDGSIVTFERDIVWITFPGRRQTEKWLYDDWRMK
ncbi:MAG: hypothetical protein AB7E76_13845 [Deferribacterales bacterium]